MTLRTDSAAYTLNIPVDHLIAAIERGDVTRPLCYQRLYAVWNEPWVNEGREVMRAQRVADEAKALARAKEEADREARRDAARRLRLPLRAVTAAAKRGDIPERPTSTDVTRLIAEQPDWFRFARCAVDAGEPNRAVTLAGIDDPVLRPALEMLAAFSTPHA